MMRCEGAPVRSFAIDRISATGWMHDTDDLPVEEPLEIRFSRIGSSDGGCDEDSGVSVTMRSPGNDDLLAAGFVFTEGMIRGLEDIESIEQEGRNAVRVRIRQQRSHVPVQQTHAIARRSFVSSSCGACGKQSIAAIGLDRRFRTEAGTPAISSSLIHALPKTLRHAQAAFSQTGGTHASGLFDLHGRLLALREDVGRHNALDKLIGGELLAGRIPLSDRVLLLSGRVSFELVQKAAAAGIPVIAAVGAPSSLAVELARECGITLLGFVRDGRFNVYSDAGRLIDEVRAIADSDIAETRA